jgi:polyisoprenoid-binding protein YceI
MKLADLRTASGKAVAGVVAPLALTALLSTGAQAQMDKPKVDLTHTSVHFTVGHGGFSRVMFEFRQIDSVDFKFDPDNVANSHIKMVINAASLDSNHYFRDNWARSTDELHVWKFPKITFESTKITKTGKNTGKVTGKLTMHGVTKEITADVTYNKGGKHVSGKYWMNGFTATGTIKRSDFGLKKFTPWISDDINFTVMLEQNRPITPADKK